jgi:mannose-1-phosphate guanylyltransferase
MTELYALIMAGGGGTRLWPRSRRDRPKQFLNIGTPHSLLRESFLRIEPLIPAERVLVVTGHHWVGDVQRELPEVPAENILGEPVGRGTAPAIGLAAEVLARRAPDAILAVLTADHLITNREGFREVLGVAAHAARDGHIVLLGIQPTEPNTGYGYIEAGERLEERAEHAVLKVESFKEKPSMERAEQFVAAGNYYWNSGMFVWSVDTIRTAMRRFLPETAARLERIGAAWDHGDRAAALAQDWEDIRSETIDYGVAERADDVTVVPADIGWTDVGSWAAVFDVLARDANNNVVEGTCVDVDARNNLILAHNRLIAAVGIEDLIVIDTEDVLLIMPRSRAQDVRAVVDRLKAQNRTELL